MNYLGDFSRLTFNPSSSYSRVLLQQGRVQLDADWNEQAAILLNYQQHLAEDLGGPHWGPYFDVGFEIEGGNDLQLSVKPGTYYVKGIRCRNESSDEGLRYDEQPGYPFPNSAVLEESKSYLVFLEVWERHISYIEDDSIREVALGGPDTAVRAQIVWQVKALEFDWVPGHVAQLRNSYPKFLEVLLDLGMMGPAPELRARAGGAGDGESEEPCILAPEARYRGAENQLYRVEVHNGGSAEEASFKWCRDNAVNFPIEALEGRIVTLEHLGRDAKLGLSVGDWVELVNDEQVLRAQAYPLLRIEAIDAVRRQVTLGDDPASDVATDPELHPQLRRWDQKAGKPEEGGVELNEDGTIPIEETDGAGELFIDLEDGIQVEFQGDDPDTGENRRYRTGDYWLIPARTATGDVLWPQEEGEPYASSPHGVYRAYAPLALISAAGNGDIDPPEDLRRQLERPWEPV